MIRYVTTFPDVTPFLRFPLLIVDLVLLLLIDLLPYSRCTHPFSQTLLRLFPFRCSDLAHTVVTPPPLPVVGWWCS